MVYGVSMIENFLLKLTQFFTLIPSKVINKRRFILPLFIFLTLFFISLIVSKSSLDLSIEAFLNEESDAQIALDEFRRQFGSDRSVFLIYKPKDGDVFSFQSLSMIEELTKSIEELSAKDSDDEGNQNYLSRIRKVKSVANLRVQINDSDGLVSQLIVPRDLVNEKSLLRSIKEKALSQSDYVSAFYSRDFSTGALVIETDFGLVKKEGFTSELDSLDIVLDEGFTDFDIDFDKSAVVQKVEFADVDPSDYFLFGKSLESVYEQYETHFDFYPVGEPSITAQLKDSLDQMAILGLLMIVIFSGLLWILFKSASALSWSMLTVASSVIWCWGITALLGYKITTMIALTILLIFSVGIADCVHVMSSYFSYQRNGLSHKEALTKAYEQVGLAILLTTLTTACGILVLATSSLEPIRIFAFMCAGGVFLAFLFTIFILPIFLDVWHPKVNKNSSTRIELLKHITNKMNAASRLVLLGLLGALIFYAFELFVGLYIIFVVGLTFVVVRFHQNILESVPNFVFQRPKLILACFSVIFGICIFGATKIVIDTNIAGLFRSDHPVSIAVNTVDESMSGSQSMEVMIDTKQFNGMHSPSVLKAVDSLQTYLEETYPEKIGRTFSLANIVKETRKIMNDSDDAYKIPDDAREISQLLFLFNSADPSERRSLVSDDYSRSHITVNAKNMGSFEYKELFNDVEMQIQKIFANSKSEFPKLEFNLTGSIATLMVVTDDIAKSQFDGFSLALGLISLIMIVTLGSVRAGVMGMIPNAIPAFLAFGLMGLFVIPLDTDTLLIAPVILGIAVDDTIHFMTHYRIELIKTKDIGLALKSAIREVGQAVMFTTMIIGLGFAVLSFSEYLGLAKVGFFGSIAIFFALLCDLLLIPAMIMLFKPTFGVSGVERELNFNGGKFAV